MISESAAPNLPTWDDPRAERLRQAPVLARVGYALKPASWPKLLVPAALGQLTGAIHAGRLDVVALALGAFVSLGLLVFIVLLNDFGDAAVDRLKRSMYPSQCSPKTIPDGLLPARALLALGLASLALALVAAFVGERSLGRAHLGVMAIACAAIFVAYSLPPLRLNYRGGGELLEALGVGVALPAWNAFAQGGAGFPDSLLDLLPAFVLLSLASALASGLSDEVSDRAGGKRTFATLLGNAPVRRAVEGSVLLAALLFVATPAARASGTGVAAGGVGTASSLVALVCMRAVTPPPDTDAFASQGRYKARLHGAIWYGTLAVMLTRALLETRR